MIDGDTKLPNWLGYLIFLGLIGAGFWMMWYGFDAGFMLQHISGDESPKRGGIGRGGPFEYEGGSAMIFGAMIIFMGLVSSICGYFMLIDSIKKNREEKSYKIDNYD